MTSRSLLCAIAASFLTCCISSTFAQESFPTKPVRLIVPWPPGGPPDLVARLVAPRLTESWGKPVIVENRAGATGSIGTDVVSKAPPDGHTLLLTSSQPIVIAPALFHTPYDPAKDLTTIAIFGESTNILVVSAALGINSVSELLAAAKAKPGALTFSSSGPGSIGHLSGELAKQIGGVDLLHVPYPGTAKAVSAVLSGEVAINFASIQQSVAHIKSGKLKALGVTRLRPSKFLPEIPPLSDVGLSGLSASAWYGAFYPPKVPAATLQLVRATLQKALQEPGLRQKLDAAGIEPLWEEDGAARMESELARYRGVVQSAGIKAN